MKNKYTNTIERIVITLFEFLKKTSTTTFNIAKFIIYDITVFLTRLPFGNLIGISYLIMTIFILKNVSDGGEFNRLLGRAIDIYIIHKKSFGDCFIKLQLYLWRTISSKMTELRDCSYCIVIYVWNYTGGHVKREVRKFAKEVIFENAEEIEKKITDAVKSAAFASAINVASQKLISNLGPVAFESFAKTDIAKSIFDIQYNIESMKSCSSQMNTAMNRMEITNDNIQFLSSNVDELFAIIIDANARGETHLIENNILLNKRMAEITMQLEYLRITQPKQFREVLKTMSLSTLALNDIAVPLSMTNGLTKMVETFGSSASQQGRTRIENG